METERKAEKDVEKFAGECLRDSRLPFALFPPLRSCARRKVQFLVFLLSGLYFFFFAPLHSSKFVVISVMNRRASSVGDMGGGTSSVTEWLLTNCWLTGLSFRG